MTSDEEERGPRMTDVSRRTFCVATSAALAATTARPRSTAAALEWIDGGLSASFPSQDPDLVRAVVGKSHVDYDAVRELVTPRPALAKAAWDWGFGDWETALGAASHMGRRDIAELLVEHGARPDLFTFAMLDQVDAVAAICAANPGIQRQHGPHGITLLQHARTGKAARVVKYLEQLGDAGIGPVNLPIDQAEAQVYAGDYEPQGAPDTVFHIAFHERRGVLTFQRDDRTPRFLNRESNHVFNPGGAASVRITFDMRDGKATALSIRDGDLDLLALRLKA